MISNGLRAAALALGVTAVVVACGDDEADKKQAAARAEQSGIDEFTKTYCEIVVTCCNRILQVPKDIPGCQKRIPLLDPIMVKDVQARADCLTQLRANTPRPDFCAEFANVEQPACPDALRKDLAGTKKVGEACAADKDCGPSYEGAVACKSSVCQLTKRGKEGDGPCVLTLDGDVELPGTPTTQATQYVCFLRDGLQCDVASKKCTKPIAAEAACTDTRQCAAGTFCEEREKKCFARVKTGKLCTQVDECEGFCKDETCAPPVAENGACDDKTPCAPGLGCVSAKCTKPGADVRLAGSCTD